MEKTSCIRQPRVAVALALVVALSWPAWTLSIERASASQQQERAASRAIPTAAAQSKLRDINHFVILFQENHSFDNLMGEWEGVDGLEDAVSAPPQIDQNGTPLTCLIQNDPSLILATPVCSGNDASGNPYQSHFVNEPFQIDEFVPVNANTCPAKFGPGKFGCTLDLNHDFLQSRYEIHGGAMDRFVVGNDVSAGLTMGHWDTHALPIYDYLHRPQHPDYAITDRFFQGAFGGSFLNHQWLVAARTPRWANANDQGTISNPGDDVHSVVDANAMPVTYGQSKEHPSLMYQSPLPNAKDILVDGPLTPVCTPKQAGADTRPTPPAGTPCGDFAINTVNPSQQPTSGEKRSQLPMQPVTAKTIADRLDAGDVSWAWYSAGWSNANGSVGDPGWTNGPGPTDGSGGTTCPDPTTKKGAQWPFCPNISFTFHHQPFNYFDAFSRTTSRGQRERQQHLRDLEEFRNLVGSSSSNCQLRQVSYLKLMGNENQHPGMRPTDGSMTETKLVKSIVESPCADDTMIILTYDEYGGAWDHVPPPGQGPTTVGPSDKWGPGPRIPTIIIAPGLSDEYVVDHTVYDTTSIAATIETRFGLPTIGQNTRDGSVNDLRWVFEASAP